jgi:hypothetical protein
MSNQTARSQSVSALSIPFLESLVERSTASAQRWLVGQGRTMRGAAVGAILAVALLAFELFNFDTTEYALEALLGPVGFAGIRWATILAIAFCSVDFAGLARLIAPAQSKSDHRLLDPAWLLLGAWLLGGGMNAIMTWWAVSLALMGHELGNEVLTREQLLRMVPILVAVLVWVTRILIISSFTMPADPAGAVETRSDRSWARARTQARSRPVRRPRTRPVSVSRVAEPMFVGDGYASPARQAGPPRPRPPMPQPARGVRPPAVPVQMKGGSNSDRTQMLS